MYTDEDLNLAVEKGIFTDHSVKEFRDLLSSVNHSSSVDEENFRLIGGFNDIFIVIACALLLFSALWVLQAFNESLGLIVFTVLSWGLAEFFVLKRKMALPAIMLLLAFIGGVFSSVASFFPEPDEGGFIVAAAFSAVAAYCHWLRFNVPITVAVGTAVGVGFIALIIVSIFPNIEAYLLGITFIGGLVTFSLAMYWDASDTQRTTRRSDVAFWLHLLSAPLIIHPFFASIGILDGNESLWIMLVVIIFYLFMTTVSIAIDRRAFMVSSLIYVLYALSTLFKNYGGIGENFALTGIIMGSALLVLSAYWHRVRTFLVNKLPNPITRYLPQVKAV